MRRRFCRAAYAVVVAACVVASMGIATSNAQRASKTVKQPPAKVCFDPAAPCPSSMPFEPNDLKFRLPKNAVIYDSEEFYAVVLKTLRVTDTDCEKFVAEPERKAAQKLFSKRKVFTSRCADTLGVYYSNVTSTERVMALYAGATREEAARTLEEVKTTGKFPDAKLRRMHASINGT
ncbi:MAG: hypothetical protein ACJ741_10515 [Pyrinomonadaceae bacterium]